MNFLRHPIRTLHRWGYDYFNPSNIKGYAPGEIVHISDRNYLIVALKGRSEIIIVPEGTPCRIITFP